MNADDPRHGSNAGYLAGCHDACCRAGHAAYKKQRRTRLYLSRTSTLTVDARGTRRRLQALAALGHSLRGVSLQLGHSASWAHKTAERDVVLQLTTDEVRAIYDRLSMIVPPKSQSASRARNHAARMGWVPPLAWDDIDRDERPVVTSINRDRVDHVVINRAMNGQKVTANPAERREVIRRWERQGWSLHQLDLIQGWNCGRDKKLSAA